jgi:hypothetical protein
MKLFFAPLQLGGGASKHAIEMRLGVMVPSRKDQELNGKSCVRAQFNWLLPFEGSGLWTCHELDPITQQHSPRPSGLGFGCKSIKNFELFTQRFGQQP